MIMSLITFKMQSRWTYHGDLSNFVTRIANNSDSKYEKALLVQTNLEQLVSYFNKWTS
jgi:hypothetical protein